MLISAKLQSWFSRQSAHVGEAARQRNPAARFGVQGAVALGGAYLLLFAARASDGWLLAHVVLPNWYLPPTTLAGFHVVRMATAAVGFLMLWLLAPRVGRWAGTQGPRKLGALCLQTAVATHLAVVASEAVVRSWDGRQPLWRKNKLEFRIGQPDERLGWIPVPSGSTVARSGSGRPVHYRIDAWGYRSASEQSAPDPSLPTLIVTGESIAFGHGLEYEDTFAAVLGQRLGLQVANAAVAGYGSDQAYLRMVDALSRFQRPVAVLTVFIPLELRRSLQDYRPRLVLRGGTLAWEPPVAGFWSRWRLRDLWVNELPYLGDRALSAAMELNAAIVRATGDAARARGAEPLFLIPSFGPARALGEHAEAGIVRELFERQGEPHLLVDIELSHIMPEDWHPDAAAARQIAATVADALRPRLAR